MSAFAASSFSKRRAWSGEDSSWGVDADEGASYGSGRHCNVDCWRLVHYFSDRGFGTLARSTKRQIVRRRQTRFLVVVAALFVLWCVFRFV